MIFVGRKRHRGRVFRVEDLKLRFVSRFVLFLENGYGVCHCLSVSSGGGISNVVYDVVYRLRICVERVLSRRFQRFVSAAVGVFKINGYRNRGIFSARETRNVRVNVSVFVENRRDFGRFKINGARLRFAVVVSVVCPHRTRRHFNGYGIRFVAYFRESHFHSRRCGSVQHHRIRHSAADCGARRVLIRPHRSVGVVIFAEMKSGLSCITGVP